MTKHGKIIALKRALQFYAGVQAYGWDAQGKYHDDLSLTAKQALGMVGGTGIEPVTPSMSTTCSTAELTAPVQKEITWITRAQVLPTGHCPHGVDWIDLYSGHRACRAGCSVEL